MTSIDTAVAAVADTDVRGYDALTLDGAIVRIRAARPSDRRGLDHLVRTASDRSIQQRFFNPNRGAAARYVQEALAEHGHTCLLVVAESHGAPVGLASLDLTPAHAGETALLIDDSVHGRGIGTLLLERIIEIARSRHIPALHADVLSTNGAMIHLFTDSGFMPTFVPSSDVVSVTLPTAASDQSTTRIEQRDEHAEHEFMRHVVSPRSIAVIGAGRNPGGVGHEVLRNLQSFGFTGRLSVVNPHTTSIRDVPSYASISAVPGPVDLAVIAVPASSVPTVVDECAAAGVRAAVVLSGGMGELGGRERADEAALVHRARGRGLRIVGPNCLGVLNTDPRVRLNATFARFHPALGSVAIGSQSGAIGISLIDEAARVHLGVSEFVSLGNKADVSGNDLLLHWAADDRTTVIALYLESIGNPRKFARIARSVGRRKPILVLKGGSSDSGARAGLSHSAAAMDSRTAVETLFRGCGVLVMDSVEEIVDAARVLTTWPPMSGPRIAVLGNAGGAGVLAADAAGEAGLQVPEFTEATRAWLAKMGAVAVSNPVDLGADAGADQLEMAARVLAASGEIDAIVVTLVGTRVGNVGACFDAVAHACAEGRIPVVGVAMGARFDQDWVPMGSTDFPVYRSASRAIKAVGHAWEHAALSRDVPSRPTLPHNLDSDAARLLVSKYLQTQPDGGWLSGELVHELLATYGISMAPSGFPHSEEAAVSVAHELGYPVVLKTASPDVIHKTDLGAVVLDLRCDQAVVDAYRRVTEAVGTPAVCVQKYAPTGVALMAGIVNDPRFGPMLNVGSGGVLTDLIDDRQWTMLPSDEEPRSMLDRLRCAPLLHGYRGTAPVDAQAAADLIMRLAQLAEAHDEIAELDLNPIMVASKGATVLDAKVRVRPTIGQDANSRALGPQPRVSSPSADSMPSTNKVTTTHEHGDAS